jgi:hypothetical protein
LPPFSRLPPPAWQALQFGPRRQQGVLDMNHASVKAVKELQEKITPDLMNNLGGILGTAIGLDDSDNVALVVYVDQDNPSKSEIIRSFPPQIRGIGVKIEETDKFRALGKNDRPSPPPPTSHTAKQTPPIQLGTSGGWSSDLANGFCCGGTLGSLVAVNRVNYILSNYHVFESDIVPGGNGVVANAGTPVIQPGLIDVSCTAASAQEVAQLEKLSSLPGSNVDCAVAKVNKNMVRTDGAILEIGTISASTAAAFATQKVKKSGRTTALTRSSVSALNATITVAYEDECAGHPAFTKTFTGQIVIANKGSKFLAGGDSGSLLVEDAGTNPRAVGLLYAGSSTTAIANPIEEVLTFLGGALGGTCTMVGQ